MRRAVWTCHDWNVHYKHTTIITPTATNTSITTYTYMAEEFSSKWQFLPFIEKGLTNYARLDMCNVRSTRRSYYIRPCVYCVVDLVRVLRRSSFCLLFAIVIYGLHSRRQTLSQGQESYPRIHYVYITYTSRIHIYDMTYEYLWYDSYRLVYCQSVDQYIDWRNTRVYWSTPSPRSVLIYCLEISR